MLKISLDELKFGVMKKVTLATYSIYRSCKGESINVKEIVILTNI